MKKIISTTILILLVFSMSACTNNPKSNNAISEAKLTKREKAILSTTSDKSFVYDFNVNSNYKELSVWIEKYEFGKLVGDKIDHITSGIKEDGSIIFTTSKTPNNQNQSLFNISINSDGSTDVVNQLETTFKDGLEGVTSISGSNQTENNPIKNNIVLASICYKKEGHRMDSLTDDFYRDVNKHIDEIRDYDVVYLLRAEFIK
ncbi:hypothetical protein AN960_12855 [Bacillus sp. FJAT-25509]|uniref:hypothetical protein n=1 Tax=Bacillaceae TaxID=186817 RepID=UPI0007022124|nr:hypothetical protein [Bacillus sp. FJAT-25509]KQL38859.1 hypothetical protein AN960_12855 [Bacillus sp. FJAT-25509]